MKPKTFPALLAFTLMPCLLSVTARDFHQLVWSSLLICSMSVTALICTSLCAFFLKEPSSSFATNSSKTAVVSTKQFS